MHVKCPLNLGGPRGLHKFSRGFAGHLGSTYLEVGLHGNPSELVLGSLVTSYQDHSVEGGGVGLMYR